MTHDEMIAVIAAHKEGKQIECKTKQIEDARWVDPCHLRKGDFNFGGFDYRIKPEPLVLWAAFYPDGGLMAVKTTESALRQFLGDELDAVILKKFMEVTE